jgi:hypothetical protein
MCAWSGGPEGRTRRAAANNRSAGRKCGRELDAPDISLSADQPDASSQAAVPVPRSTRSVSSHAAQTKTPGTSGRRELDATDVFKERDAGAVEFTTLGREDWPARRDV